MHHIIWTIWYGPYQMESLDNIPVSWSHYFASIFSPSQACPLNSVQLHSKLSNNFTEKISVWNRPMEIYKNLFPFSSFLKCSFSFTSLSFIISISIRKHFHRSIFLFRTCIQVTILPHGISSWNFQLNRIMLRDSRFVKVLIKKALSIITNYES